MENFSTIDYILLFITLAYGIVLGFKNIYLRVYFLFVSRSINQSDLGRVLDIVFVILIGYLGAVYQGRF